LFIKLVCIQLKNIWRVHKQSSASFSWSSRIDSLVFYDNMFQKRLPFPSLEPSERTALRRSGARQQGDKFSHQPSSTIINYHHPQQSSTIINNHQPLQSFISRTKASSNVL
jgi:hypothetical protein